MLSGFERLKAKLLAGDAVVAGVLSGTSADGIDVAVFRPRFERRAGGLWLQDLGLVGGETRAFGERLAGRLRKLLDADAGLDGARITLGELARFHGEIGAALGRAAHGVADDLGVALDLVGSHGQTVWHHSGGPVRASLQLGDGDFVAEAAGCAVVSDFRSRDLAAGGEGAPIGALVDPWLFSAGGEVAVLNLGGFGNLTLLRDGRVQHNFDTGPAGALLDGLARQLLDAEFDAGGRAALAGDVHAELLQDWRSFGGAEGLESFVQMAPPKSTGRDRFGARWCAALLEPLRFPVVAALSPEDLCATAVELVAWSVASSLQAVGWQPVQIEVCGGGVHHAGLMAALQRLCGARVGSSAAAGVDPDLREAFIFGLLGCAHVLDQPLPLDAGDGRSMVLGKWSPGR